MLQRLALQTKVEKRTPEEIRDFKEYSQSTGEGSFYALCEAFRLSQSKEIRFADIDVETGEDTPFEHLERAVGTDEPKAVEAKPSAPAKAGAVQGRGAGRGRGKEQRKERPGDANIVRRWKKEDMKKERSWDKRSRYEKDDDDYDSD